MSIGDWLKRALFEEDPDYRPEKSAADLVAELAGQPPVQPYVPPPKGGGPVVGKCMNFLLEKVLEDPGLNNPEDLRRLIEEFKRSYHR